MYNFTKLDNSKQTLDSYLPLVTKIVESSFKPYWYALGVNP